MSSAPLKTQLNKLMNYMFAMEFLGDYFKTLQMLENDGCPGFIAEITPLFGKQVEGFLSELSKLLCEPLVDFEKIDAYLRRLW
ncbi:histidine-containing phosphotransfer protein 1-like [Carex rostrata]